MKKYFSFFFCIGLSACGGGDQASLEEASYYLGKGDEENSTENATKALNIVNGLITSTDPEVKFEAARLYAGAQASVAGFNSIKIFSNLVYKEGNDTVAFIRSAVRLSSDAATRLGLAETQLLTAIGDSDYASQGSQTRLGLQFQLGLIRLFQAARTTLVASGLSTLQGSFSPTECVNALNSSDESLTSINSDLVDSKTALTTGSGLDSQNSIVELVDAFEEEVPDATTFSGTEKQTLCEYLAGQSAK